MHTITGYSAAGIHLHTLDDTEIVDVVGVISAGLAGSEVALKVGRARRYPGTHCRTCGIEVTREAAREQVALSSAAGVSSAVS